jgi:DNA-binding transcriptional regulator YhcF (GntR family)
VDEEDAGTNGSRPPYRYIADVLRGEIHDGRYPVGQRIPSQAELEDRFQVSRPTIQRALGVLRDDGYIDNQRGRPSEVLPWEEREAPLPSEEPEPAYVVLAAHLAEAFKEPDVVIEAYSLTSETLSSALALPIQRVQAGDLNPRSITVRLMLPSLDTHLAIPRLVSDPTDDWPLRRLRQLVRSHAVAVRSTFTGLSQLRPDITQSIEFRTVPITPVHKLYLINKRTALFAYYQVLPREIRFGTKQPAEIFDVLGISATLFARRYDESDPESADSAFVAESQGWFTSLWSTIAEPLTLFE